MIKIWAGIVIATTALALLVEANNNPDNDPFILRSGEPYIHDEETIKASVDVARFAHQYQRRQDARSRAAKRRKGEELDVAFETSDDYRPEPTYYTGQLDYAVSQDLRLPRKLVNEHNKAEKDSAIMTAKLERRKRQFSRSASGQNRVQAATRRKNAPNTTRGRKTSPSTSRRRPKPVPLTDQRSKFVQAQRRRQQAESRPKIVVRRKNQSRKNQARKAKPPTRIISNSFEIPSPPPPSKPAAKPSRIVSNSFDIPPSPSKPTRIVSNSFDIPPSPSKPTRRVSNSFDIPPPPPPPRQRSKPYYPKQSYSEVSPKVITKSFDPLPEVQPYFSEPTPPSTPPIRHLAKGYNHAGPRSKPSRVVSKPFDPLPETSPYFSDSRYVEKPPPPPPLRYSSHSPFDSFDPLPEVKPFFSEPAAKPLDSTFSTYHYDQYGPTVGPTTAHESIPNFSSSFTKSRSDGYRGFRYQSSF